MNIRRLITKRYCGLRRLFLTEGSGTPGLLLMGDSLTLSCYPVFLSRILRQRGYPACIRIVAKNGIPISELLNILEQTHNTYRNIKLAVLLIGGNDLKTGRVFDADAFFETLNRILTLLLTHDEGSSILLCTVPVPGPHPALPADSPYTIRTVLNPLIRDVAAKRNGLLCELECIFDCDASLRTDGVHPTVKGDRLLAETIGENIISYLKSNAGETS